jgi:hypothetical protein
VDSNVAIASAITSYARIRLHGAITAIEQQGGTVYYCDTDSIMCNLDLSANPVLTKKYRPDGTGETLGGLKNEMGMRTCVRNGTCMHAPVDIPFDTLTIVGCKMYSYSGECVKTELVSGVAKSTTTRKCVDRIKGCTNPETGAIQHMNTGGVYKQTQSQLLCNRSDYLREEHAFNIRPNTVTKRFNKLYTKGVVGEFAGGACGYAPITPLTI